MALIKMDNSSKMGDCCDEFVHRGLDNCPVCGKIFVENIRIEYYRYCDLPQHCEERMIYWEGPYYMNIELKFGENLKEKLEKDYGIFSYIIISKGGINI